MDSEDSHGEAVVPETTQLIDKDSTEPDAVSQGEVADDENGPRPKENKLSLMGFTVCETLQINDGNTIVARIQTDKYFPFSKRCVRVGETFFLPKLPGNLTHGAHMFKLLKHDYNEEFEFLPRAGQKVGSHILAEQTEIQDKRIRLYSRLRSAYNSPRYLELWKSESGDQLAVPITAELNWQNGKALSAHTSLGSFGKYFGTTFSGVGMDSHSLMRKLSPYEAMFLADCGTLQVTASQCPLGVEDLLAIQEANVWRFVNRYLVFSELHRSTRFAFRTYSEEAKLDFVEPEISALTIQPHRYPQKRLRYNLQVSQPSSELFRGTETNQEFRGFFSEGTEKPRDLLTLPSLQTNAEVEARIESLLSAVDSSETTAATSQYNGGKVELLSESKGTRDLRNTLHRRVRVRGSNGIDLAFYGCLKSADWTPPLFDVAITNYRDHSVNVSELFLCLEKRKNQVLPMLVERVDYGQVSGYALIPARVPAVDYIAQN